MKFKLEQELSKADSLQQVDELKRKIDAKRPLPADVEDKVMQKLKLDWNYHSNAIEGNSLSYGETLALLQYGITAKDKPLKDHMGLKGHNEAIEVLLKGIIKEGQQFSEKHIQNIHSLILVEPYQLKVKMPDGVVNLQKISPGEYKKMQNHVRTGLGEFHYYTSPEETPAKMQGLIDWYHTVVNEAGVHPLVIAALLHHKFVAIHPFDDGNGRVARILMNLVLIQNGYPPVIIRHDDKLNHYTLLGLADAGDLPAFINHIADNMLASLNTYLKAIDGHDIEEDEDISREISLFRSQIKEQVIAKTRKSYKWIRSFLTEEVNPFMGKLYNTLKPFGEDFADTKLTADFVFVIEGYLLPTMAAFTDTALDAVKERFNYLKGVNLTITFKKFNNPDNVFDIASVGYIYFEEYKYDIYGNKHKLILSKSYSESLTADDYKKIVRSYVDDIKTQIQEHMK
jgi:Fic family protein